MNRNIEIDLKLVRCNKIKQKLHAAYRKFFMYSFYKKEYGKETARKLADAKHNREQYCYVVADFL